MNAKNSPSITPADVAAQALQDNLVTSTTVPAQGEAPKVIFGETVKGTDVGGGQAEDGEKTGKKSFKERIADATEQLKKHKAIAIAVSVAVGTATIAFVKYAKQQAEKSDQMSDEDRDTLDQVKADAESIADLG